MPLRFFLQEEKFPAGTYPLPGAGRRLRLYRNGLETSRRGLLSLPGACSNCRLESASG